MASWPIVPHLTVCNLVSGLVSDATVLISCAEIPDLTHRAAVHLHFYFPDSAQLPDLDLAARIADFAAHAIGCGRDVVTHCDEGKNRSVFMAGLILHAMGTNHSVDLVAFLRTQRPGALTAPGDGGPVFADYLNHLT